MLVLIASVLLASVAGILGKDEITSRWNATVENIAQYQESGEGNSSIGLRLIMWDAAVKIWYRHPIIGTGIGDFHKDYAEMIKSGEAGFPGVTATPFSYAHSTIFDALAGTGILGLASMIVATFIMPIVFFLKALKASINEHDRYAAVFGLVFVYCRAELMINLAIRYISQIIAFF